LIAFEVIAAVFVFFARHVSRRKAVTAEILRPSSVQTFELSAAGVGHTIDAERRAKFFFSNARHTSAYNRIPEEASHAHKFVAAA
jgi:hypothetical protein